jgi:hypothetical protein
VSLLVLATFPAPAGARQHAVRAGADKTTKMLARFEAERPAGRAARRGGRDARRRAGGRPRGRDAVRPRRPRAPRPGTGGSQSSAPRPAGTNVPRFGVFTHDSPYSGNVDNVNALQDRLGRDIAIVNWYQSWGGGAWVSQVQQHVIKAVTDSGRTPLLTWEPWDPAAGADQPAYRLRAIAEGAHDAYIAAWADALRDNGAEIYLRPMHEMNGTWYPWGARVGDNSPELYRAAWRRMHDIFAQRGATNVKWVWCPLNYDVAGSPMEDWYPGTEYVDVLSVDGYNWGSKHPENGGWQSFEEVFRDSYRRLSALGPQPIWIAEVGSAPEGGDKAQWVRDMWATARAWDRLEAIVWFDQDKEEDWRASPVAEAFRP